MSTDLIEELAQEAESILHTVEETEQEYINENNDSSEAEQSLETSPTESILDLLEEPTNISELTGIKKTRAIQQKIELQNIKGKSLAMTIPEINDRALFRVVFQILFQAQRVKEQLDLAVLSDLNDELMVGMESSRLSSEQKVIISELSNQTESLKAELNLPKSDQSIEKIKNFEKNLDEKIEIINQWIEPFISQFC
jgi:hypothetical protein